MNEPKHSPGPWTAAGPYAVLDAGRESIATCAGPNKAANKALIAAAPEVLEACRDILFAWECGDDAGRDLIAPLDDARRAIAKATGE